MITGADFEPGKTEVWMWEGPKQPGGDQALPIGEPAEKALPAEPPADARQIGILDCERQVIVAPVQGVAVWVKTSAGFSRPCVVNLARPCWLSQSEARAGETLHVFGFGLRADYRRSRVALKGEKTFFVDARQPSRDLRAEDPSLFYFDLPHDISPGQYSVLVHNGYGGAIGWRTAGRLSVTNAPRAAEKVFSVAAFGAKGDDEENDFAAIEKALAAAVEAAKTGARGVVHFPPGKFRTDTTISVPSGVTLRGASRDLSVIEGFGQLPPDRKTTALIHAASHTALESLTFQGFTVKGPGAYWMALVNPPPAPGDGPVEDFAMRGCRLYADAVRASQPRYTYVMAFALPRCRNVEILDNDIHGPLGIGDFFLSSYRVEVIGNTIHGGGNADNVSFNVTNSIDSLIDANTLVDGATRFLVNSRRHTAIRFNEVHQYNKAIWTNAEETFLIHGDQFKSVGKATAATATSLDDARQKWKPGQWREAEVLIVSGRGFGQHRTVTDNTATRLTLESPWRVTPDATSEFVVGNLFVENYWFANLNDTPGRTSLWLDHVGNVVDRHRDSYAGGIDIWGDDDTAARPHDELPAAARSNRFLPAWYNMIMDCWMDGSMIKLWSHVNDAGLGGPAMFANAIVGNRVRQPHMNRTGFELTPRIDGGVWVGNRSGAKPSRTAAHRPALSHTIVSGNDVSHTPRGVSVSDTARKTFVLGNTFEDVATPVLDWGPSTVVSGNRRHVLDEKGERFEPVPDADRRAKQASR